MKKIIRTATMAAALTISSRLTAQGYIEYGCSTRSSMTDKTGNKHGNGTMQTVTGKFAVPLSMRTDSTGRITAWKAAMSALYATLDNYGMAKELNPPNVFNGNLNVMHIRPLSRRWSLMATIGCGVYAPTDMIRARSILANGGALFVYRINNGMSVGVGGGLTNSYGVPMVMPMVYFSWASRGRYEFKVDMSSSMEISVATWLNKRIKIELVAIEMDGMAAVTETDGKAKIYSSVAIGSRLRPSVLIGGKTSAFVCIGGTWMRGTEITDRSLRGFADSFRDDKNSPYFRPAIRISAGIAYGL